MKLVTLCSGGVDSVTMAYMLASEGVTQSLLFVDYGQKQIKEYDGADHCATALGIALHTVEINGNMIFKSALTSPFIDVPDGRYTPENIAVTVVPNRNAIMANLAAALAISLDYTGIALAIHAGDHAVYPDTTPAFVGALVDLLQTANGRAMYVEARFVHWSKTKIILMGTALGVPYEKTWSCYKGGTKHCGQCSTCLDRKVAFVAAGVSDPTEYEI